MIPNYEAQINAARGAAKLIAGLHRFPHLRERGMVSTAVSVAKEHWGSAIVDLALAEFGLEADEYNDVREVAAP